MTHQVLFVGGRKGPLRSYSQEPKLVQRTALGPFRLPAPLWPALEGYAHGAREGWVNVLATVEDWK